MQKLKVVVRNSPLSIAQVKEVFHELNKDIEYELIPILSYGDKHKEIYLMKNIPEDFFTRELDEAVLKSEADIAIHSAKDLPFPLPEGIDLIALTMGKTKKDALVSKDKMKLLDLPLKAKIGVSSLMRRENILKIRPDLKIIPIRGTIEERISMVEKKFVDAIVVAACALERLGYENRISEILPFETHPLQGKLAVTARRGRPELKKLFFDIDERKFYGKVYLVGAGPGDSNLLTIKAKSCLEYADIVLYDDLVHTDILNFAYRAQDKLYVGKRAGKHSVSQSEINELLYQYALRGKNIVRLKGGEPLIFGRAQEEIDYLLERFVSVEVINGISSAFASASDLLISLTNRNCGSKIVFESGHINGKEYKDSISSYVFYMGSTSKKEIKKKMLKHFSFHTSVLLVQNASLPQEVIVKTTLDKLEEVELSSPLIIIVGDAGNYYTRLPKILYTGINPFETISKIQGRVVHYPLIKREKIYPLPDIEEDYDALVFTSGFSVDVWTDYFGIKKKRIYAIGPRTKEKLLARGYQNIILPATFDSTSLSEILKKNENESKILYPCSLISENEITSLHNVIKFPVYKTLPCDQLVLELSNFDGVYFASGSCVDAFMKIYSKIPEHLVLYAGGKVTFNKLKMLGEEKRTIILEKIMND